MGIDNRTPVGRMLADARGRLDRLTAQAAYEAWTAGALLVDVRTQEQRRAGGEIPEAITVSLNHLEWRFDPDEPSHLPVAGAFDRTVVLLCEEGYCSSLAAVRLQALGYRRATDVEGGFLAWRAQGLPLREPQLLQESSPPA